MRPALVIFVDSLPYEIAIQHHLFKDQGIELSHLIPGLGFSINLYSEMFCGKTPDDLGFFNEWSLQTSPQSWHQNRGMIIAFDRFRGIPLMGMLTHKLHDRLTGKHTANIPFRYLPLFKQQDHDIYLSRELGSVIAKYAFHVVQCAAIKNAVGQRDPIGYELALHAVRSGCSRVFVSFVDLDNIAHIYGMDSERYTAHFRKLDLWIRTLIKEFEYAHGESVLVFILSDHGMAPVSQTVDLQLERWFGLAGRERYVYFLDSVFLRVWTKDTSLLRDILCFLSETDVGRVIQERERAIYGITNPAHGTLVYQLNEGGVFSPNFHGWRIPKAMHGYDPQLPSQKGIFAQYPGQSVTASPVSSLHVYRLLHAALEGE